MKQLKIMKRTAYHKLRKVSFLQSNMLIMEETLEGKQTN